jgi:hypothetical protein
VACVNVSCTVLQMFETFATLRENRKRFAKYTSVLVSTLVSFASLAGMFNTVSTIFPMTTSTRAVNARKRIQLVHQAWTVGSSYKTYVLSQIARVLQ